MPSLLDRFMPRNLLKDSSPTKMLPSYVSRSMSEQSGMRKSLPSLQLSPMKNCKRFKSGSLSQQRSLCPQVHYFPWCEECQMMVVLEEPPPLTNKRPKTSTPSFRDLVRAVRVQANSPYQFPLAWRQAQEQQKNMMELCQEWRREQFTKAVTTRQEQVEHQQALQLLAQKCQEAHGKLRRK